MRFFDQNFMYKTWSSESEFTVADSKNPILKEIRMLTFSTGTNIKGPLRQKIGNALEILKSLKKSEFGPREGGKLTTSTPVSLLYDAQDRKSIIQNPSSV